MSGLGVNTSLTYDNTVNGICERVSTLLNDVETGRENQRWGKNFVRALVIDSLWMLAQLQPDLFTEEIEFELASETCNQSLPEECDKLVEFICVIDKTTGREMPVTTGRYDTIQAAAHYPVVCGRCRGGATANITNYQIAQSKNNTRSFVVSPIPPAGTELCARALCVSLNSFTDANVGNDGELPSELRQWILPIVNIVMYMALSMDRDNPTIAAMATNHLNSFTQLTSISLAAIQNAMEQSGVGNN